MMRRWTFTLAFFSTIVAACGSTEANHAAPDAQADSVRADSIVRAKQDSVNRAQPGYVVDSILPVEEELRRFRAAIGGAPATSFTGASSSRGALVRRFVAAVAGHDTVDLRAMLLSPREFADLVYPSSPYTHPPYRQSPALVWRQIVNPTESGFRRLLQRRGGVRFQYVGHSCKPSPVRQGDNALWVDCTLSLIGPDRDTTTQRWFGTIVEREGRFKFMSYANQF